MDMETVLEKNYVTRQAGCGLAFLNSGTRIVQVDHMKQTKMQSHVRQILHGTTGMQGCPRLSSSPAEFVVLSSKL